MDKKTSSKTAKKVEKIEKEVKTVEKSRKEQFDEILAKIKKMSEAIELHDSVKTAVEKEEVDYNYLRYIENSLEDKLFKGKNTKEIMPKILLEIVCPDLINIENFNADNLQIENVGSHFEEQENYIDKICVYNNKFISVFGINEMHPNKVIKYEPRKFSRVDMIQAVKSHYKDGDDVSLYQYDEYYVCIDDDGVKVFSQRKITSLVTVKETIFDKIKEKLLNMFAKKKTYPNVELVYDSNPNRISGFKKSKSKNVAKNRMQALLRTERELTREVSEE